MPKLEQHDYVPDIMAMGDCAVCGHVAGAAIHDGPVTQAATRRNKFADDSRVIIDTPSAGGDWMRDRFINPAKS